MLNFLKNVVRSRSSLFLPYYYIQNFFKNKKLPEETGDLDDFWIKRIGDTLSSPDLHRIDRVIHAGHLYRDYQIMHNGLKIHIGSYYGVGKYWYAYHELFKRTGGVHEPQEEYVFQEVLKFLPNQAVMVELGAYWAFYSMWFNQKISQAQNYLIEPEPKGIYEGKRNFKLNNIEGDFNQAFVASKYIKSNNGIGSVSVDYFMKLKRIDFIHILHSDIQGFELEMLKGATEALTSKKLLFLFISTHSNELHEQCIEYLNNVNYKIIADANLDQSFSYDGLIVATSDHSFPVIKINLR